ncbi:glucose 1-dehydrogenase [Halorubrum gandharaense]
MNGIDGAVAVVTGGSKGIGKATAMRLADEGASVVVADVDREAGTETVRAIRSAGGDASFVETDVSDPDAAAAMVEAAVETYGGLDIAVNNAGIITQLVEMEEITDDDWERVLDINLTGVRNCMRAELPELADGGGAVVNVASVAGLVGMPALSGYSASKHGVVGLTRSTALEYADRDVRINAVAPGPTKTDIKPQGAEETPDWFLDLLPDGATAGKGVSGRVLNWLSGGIIDKHAKTPMGRLGDPEEIAGAIAFLASTDASYITGQVLPVDGGQTAD